MSSKFDEQIAEFPEEVEKLLFKKKQEREDDHDDNDNFNGGVMMPVEQIKGRAVPKKLF